MSDQSRFAPDDADNPSRGLMGVRPQCSNCRWRDKTNPRRCKAFPDEIPLAIRLNQFDHRKPMEGDNGLRYYPLNPDIPHPLNKYIPDS